MTLADAKRGQVCIIKDLQADTTLLQKLLDMGFVVGSKVEVLRYAPLLDPIEVKVQNYSLSLRRSEAMMIEVESL